MTNHLEYLLKLYHKPKLFEQGEPLFWDDPHISKSMLEAHLDPAHDAASRRPETIEKTVNHLLAANILRRGMRVLDLGCGPGLYAEKLARAGIDVVGLDISNRSLDFARSQAIKEGLAIDYRCMNFFDMDFVEEFDAVVQVYGEICIFPDEMRDRLFGLIHKALKKEGVFIFDVTTRAHRLKSRIKNGWYAGEGGFWRAGKHVVLEQGFDYPEEAAWLDQYIVIDETNVKVYRNWFKDYSLSSVRAVLKGFGFEVSHAWNDLTGSSFTDDGEWIAICAQKGEQ